MTKHVPCDALASATALPRSAHDLARRDAIAAGSLYAEELGSDLLELLETDLSARDRAWRILEVWRNFRPLALEQYRALRATLKTLADLDTQARIALKQAGIRPPQADDPAVVVDGDRDRLNEHLERLAEARDATRTWLIESGVISA